MTLSQKGIQYDGRNELDPIVRRAVDSAVSQSQAIARQVQATLAGTTPTPNSPTQVSVTNSGGFASVVITPNHPVKGEAYIIEYSTTPNFLNPVTIDNGISVTWHQYLSGQSLYFRAASTLYTSDQSPWTYFGISTAPLLTTF